MDRSTSPDEGYRPIVIWRDGQREIHEGFRWGLRPSVIDDKPHTLLRSEGKVITRPCLIVANDFRFKSNGKQYWAKLITDAPFFCLAGVWEGKRPDWPAAFAGLTVPAYPDMAPYHDRHMAVVREDDWDDWLQQRRPVDEILRPFLEGSFQVTVERKGASRDLFDVS